MIEVILFLLAFSMLVTAAGLFLYSWYRSPRRTALLAARRAREKRLRNALFDVYENSLDVVARTPATTRSPDEKGVPRSEAPSSSELREAQTETGGRLT